MDSLAPARSALRAFASPNSFRGFPSRSSVRQRRAALEAGRLRQAHPAGAVEFRPGPQQRTTARRGAEDGCRTLDRSVMTTAGAHAITCESSQRSALPQVDAGCLTRIFH